MARTNKSPNTKDLLGLKTKWKIINYADREGWKVVDRGRIVYIGNAKCTFDSAGKLLMVE